MDMLSMGKRACIYDDKFRAQILFSKLEVLMELMSLLGAKKVTVKTRGLKICKKVGIPSC